MNNQLNHAGKLRLMHAPGVSYILERSAPHIFRLSRQLSPLLRRPSNRLREKGPSAEEPKILHSLKSYLGVYLLRQLTHISHIRRL